MKKKINALIVEDIEFSRILLREYLSKFDYLSVVGEADNLNDAANQIENTQPDVIFLDIDLNGVNAMELIHFINQDIKLIFITGNPEFAAKAFEINATDYIVKPYNLPRLKQAIEKLNIPIDNEPKKIDKFDMGMPLTVNIMGKLLVIDVSEISHIEASGNYTKVTLIDGRVSTIYETIKNWEAKLPEQHFMRIHRSTIVNLTTVDKVTEYRNLSGLVYQKHTRVPLEVSKNYYQGLVEKLKI